MKETSNKSVINSVTRAPVLDKMFVPKDDIQRYLEGEFSHIFAERGIPPFPSLADAIHR